MFSRILGDEIGIAAPKSSAIRLFGAPHELKGEPSALLVRLAHQKERQPHLSVRIANRKEAAHVSRSIRDLGALLVFH